MPAHDRPLWSLSARELCAAFTGGLSPNVAIAATLAQIRQVNPHLNATIALDETGAIEAATSTTSGSGDNFANATFGTFPYWSARLVRRRLAPDGIRWSAA